MKNSTKIKIIEAWNYCDEEDKSTEFMLAYCADMANVDYMVVVDYISTDQATKDREYYAKYGHLK